MTRPLLFLLAILTGCGPPQTSPPVPEPPAPLVTTPWPGVWIEWHAEISQQALDRSARPGGLDGHVLGTAWMRPDGVCEVHVMFDRLLTPEVSAHEAAHCLAIAQRGDWTEAPAVAYVPRYLQSCGVSVAPLGLPDPRPATCTGPPDL
ncbi:hypothetical protein IHN32_00340 [Deinococcus sp. 14RED07]|uniref:hypothetical protein n=1 Tax=unclassified Deinococcus TaxID=2623546 RepID=UPI001E5EB2FD|nr:MULTISPECIES: hypothetical protein [unclassified Deinococcus]MCD0164872.1 hypothetical protein [Deinococcus sp. 12RED42]MCD0174405.1 hypothetical protein [Deinococcus sp. 14RED07]